MSISGRGFSTLVILTGPGEIGDRYVSVGIKEKQTCMIKGNSVVVYYRRIKGTFSATIAPRFQQQIQGFLDSKNSQFLKSQAAVDLKVYLQTNSKGKFGKSLGQIGSPTRNHQC